MVPPHSHGVSRVPWYSGSSSSSFAISPTGLLPRFAGLPRPFGYHYLICYRRCPNPTIPKYHGLGSSPFARRYSGNRCFFLFLGVLRCFSSPSFPSVDYLFIYGYAGFSLRGFPHSDIHGSTPACGSPWLFAAYHVLRRLPVPRHSPFALLSLTLLYFCLVFFVSCSFQRTILRGLYLKKALSKLNSRKSVPETRGSCFCNSLERR